MANDSTSATTEAEHIRHEMLDEGRRLVDAARSAGLTLRLLGGLAVREHCRTMDLCARDYSDLDMVARAKQARGLESLFAGFGYTENYEVSTATWNARLQFVRPCEHAGGRGADGAHADCHIDVFLDHFRMDHHIDLASRLDIEPYTVSLSDLLLTKLQIFQLEEKDLRDIVTLLGDVALGEDDAPGLINSRYIAELCAADWGLYTTLSDNLVKARQLLPEVLGERLAPSCAASQIDAALARLDRHPKSFAWKTRARVGRRVRWYEVPEEVHR